MRFSLTSGSLFNGLAIIGAGAAVMLPNERWIGAIIILVGLLALICDVKFERGRLEIGSHRPFGYRLIDMIPQLIMLFGGIVFAVGLILYLRPPMPVVSVQSKITELQQDGQEGATADQISKPDVKATEKQSLPDQDKRATILSKLSNKYPQRIILNIAPEYLMNLYKDKLTIEGDRAIAPYIGNWLLLSGPLDDVSGPTVLFGSKVTFEREFGKPFIHMYFDDLWIKRLHVLTPKQNIFALCQLRDAGSATVIFHHCEVIDQDSGLPFSVP